eukprot:CAMPEP_0184688382 /NCGR_PEP_ID=MMETSP0312-20130426/29688_1 /TAXON_ID=31354 /ORGANISM="Compsopogon coeruleus, Strain SAG 36.94" /LENGTH=439 /DNA_ID=CAMNT_0027145479 /DNA_START=13 /DNA_END=1332 /DNA_ORIENTATION=+
MPQWLLAQREEFGKVFQLWFWHRRVVVVTDLDDVKYILVTKNWPKTPAFISAFGSLSRLGIFVASNEVHRVRRRAIGQVFHEELFRKLHSELEVDGKRFIANLQAKHGVVFDLDTELIRLTLSIILRVSFGAETRILDGEEDGLLKMMRRFLSGAFKNVARYPFSRLLPGRKQFDQATQELMEYTRRILKRQRELRSQMTTPKGDLLDVLIELSDGDDDYIVSEIVTFMIAGHDTTSHTLSFLVKELAEHHDVRNRLIQEIDQLLPDGGLPSFEQVKKLNYTTCCWKEALRLHPVAATGPSRIAPESSVLPSSKLFIPKGTELLVPPYVIHLDDSNYPEAKSFRPERWIDNNKRPPVMAFQGFSSGQRNCVGQFFANHEAVFVLSVLYWHFRVDLACDPADVEEFHAFTMRPRVRTSNVPLVLPVRVEPRRGHTAPVAS